MRKSLEVDITATGDEDYQQVADDSDLDKFLPRTPEYDYDADNSAYYTYQEQWDKPEEVI